MQPRVSLYSHGMQHSDAVLAIQLYMVRREPDFYSGFVLPQSVVARSITQKFLETP